MNKIEIKLVDDLFNRYIQVISLVNNLIYCNNIIDNNYNMSNIISKCGDEFDGFIKFSSEEKLKFLNKKISALSLRGDEEMEKLIKKINLKNK